MRRRVILVLCYTLPMKRPFYTQFAWAYDSLIQAPLARRVAFIERCLTTRAVSPGSSVLDAGCGTGAYSLALSQGGFRVTGLDLSQELVDVANRKLSGGCHQISFIQGDLLKLPSTIMVDAILCRGVLNDFVDDTSRRQALLSFAAVLRPQGVLILDVRDWDTSASKWASEPLFQVTAETEKGKVTFRSVTSVDHGTRTLHVSERHILEQAQGHQEVDYDFVMGCWTQDELHGTLSDAGYEEIKYFGDYDENVTVGSTDRIVALARLRE